MSLPSNTGTFVCLRCGLRWQGWDDNCPRCDRKERAPVTLNRPRRAIYVYGTTEGTYRFIERDDGSFRMEEHDPISFVWEFLHVVAEESVKREVKAFLDNGYSVNFQNFEKGADPNDGGKPDVAWLRS